MSRSMNRILFSFFCFTLSSVALAAQTAQVIVPSANVYLYPAASSKVLAKLGQGDSIVVSNLPTEGFFKTRLRTGDMGWISGNDILSGEGASRVAVPAVNTGNVAPLMPNAAPPAPEAEVRHKPKKKLSHVEEQVPDGEDSFRALVGYGISRLSYAGGFQDRFQFTQPLNSAKDLSFEFQFRMKRKLFWAVRIEYISTSSQGNFTSGGVAITSGAQTISTSLITVQPGIVWSPIYTENSRLGIGAYLGLDVGNTTVQQTPTSGTGISIPYAGEQPVATIAAQYTYGLSDAFGVFGELGYRYDRTGKFGQTTGVTAAPSDFLIDYSGAVFKLGLEIRL
jgi:hypothetical protein